MEAPQIGESCIEILVSLLGLISDFARQQNETPIYNLAAGTCLNVKVPKNGATITLDLCTESEYNKWDLLKTAL